MSNNSGTVDLTDKIAVITGASRGIGRAVALAYAKAGAHVVLVARTTGALEELDDEITAAGGQATLMPLDLRAFDKVDMMGPALAEKFGRLDIFVGNAGFLGTLGPLPHADAKDFQKVMEINLQANFRLIRTLDPVLRAAPAGRMIFTSSGLGQRPLAYFAPYCASKAALNLMVQSYAAETEKTNLRINLIDPGVVDTAMIKEAFPGGYQGDLNQPEDVVPLFLQLASENCDKHGEVVGPP